MTGSEVCKQVAGTSGRDHLLDEASAVWAGQARAKWETTLYQVVCLADRGASSHADRGCRQATLVHF